jgi:hypothetical protein
MTPVCFANVHCCSAVDVENVHHTIEDKDPPEISLLMDALLFGNSMYGYVLMNISGGAPKDFDAK